MDAHKRIPEAEWIWLGYPQHFVAADSCRFRMATIVGNVVVSTVGDYRLDGSPQKQPRAIGCGKADFYETFVFHCDGMESCGCCANITDLSEIWGGRAPNAVAAQKMHMDVCRAFAEGRQP